MPKLVADRAVDIPTGEYSGVIVGNKVMDYEQGYTYHDTVIEVDVEGKPQLKVGVPFSINKKTKLGSILERFGAKVVAGKEYDTDEYLKKGMKVKFSVIKERSKKDSEIMFSHIVAETLEPVKK